MAERVARPSPLQDMSTASDAAGARTTPTPTARAPNPAKRAVANSSLDDFRNAVTRDALREEASKQPTVSAPVLAAAPNNPSTSANMTPSFRPGAAIRTDAISIMPRNPSIDSTVSSTSSTAGSQKINGANSYRVSQESAEPQDIASLIAAAGSPEAAVQKLITEKNQAASHNAQLWRLVEKQRAMILGLNKDLEKSLKDKERYRRKLKESLVQSQSAPALTTANQQLEEMVQREDSRSPAVAEDGATAPASVSIRDMSIDSHQTSDHSDGASVGPGRSDTPLEASNLPSAIPTPQSANSGHAIARDLDSAETRRQEITATAQSTQREPMYISTRGQDYVSKSAHQQTTSISSVTTPPPSAASFSQSKTQATRKAPPARLNLASPKMDTTAAVTNNIMDASDSEYEEEPQSARAEQRLRGRRKTREEDDREREAVAREEEEHRSRSKKEKKSKSSETSSITPVERAVDEVAPLQTTKPQTYQPTGNPAMIAHQRAGSDMLQRSIVAPSLLSPGLPMSPRPGDRPMNSPMPRAPNKLLNSMPMSPKGGMAGLPLSPRAPRQPIPMPPQTPLSFASPHLARAEAYQTTQPQPSSLAQVVNSSPKSSPEYEGPSPIDAPTPISPQDVYQGLVTEQYPDLLLPPNALPSIIIKTASSRMRPARYSYIAKTADENPVFTLAVHERSSTQQLWRVEKTFAALAQLDEQVKIVCAFRERLPDKTLFSGHAPARIDARRIAIDHFFTKMLDAVTEDRAAMVICRFLSTDTFGAANAADYFGSASDILADTPISKRPHREGYLTKRGKNFGGWKARFFILEGPVLKYYDNKGGAQLGSIKLQNAQIGKQSNNDKTPQEDEENQFRHAFLILEPKKKDSSSLVRHVLCAENDDERDAWVDTLLQYVDYKEDPEEAAARAAATATKAESGGLTPRLQKSFGDLRPSSRGREATDPRQETMRAVGYNDTVAGDAPVMGPPTARKIDTPSPPHDGNFGPAVSSDQLHYTPGNPAISGPTNLQVISNTGDWGMRPPPMTPGKAAKRSIFAGFRGRSSSDLGSNDKLNSPGLPPQDHYATQSPRAVFGAPLADAVAFARPHDVDTELPAVVYRCFEYLTLRNAIAEEGIFRQSGSNTVIKALKDRFNTEGDVNLIAEGTNYDIHAVASLLKLYLRELPVSVLTRELHLEFLQCLESHGKDKIPALNGLVNRLPRPNRALLQALASFLAMVVHNADLNKMNVRNVGIVFAPTLNVPGPLISSFVEDQAAIFGAPVNETEPQITTREISAPMATDLRSPRKQMFSDLPTPAYNQTTFQSFGAIHNDNTGMGGMIPMHPSYANYQMAPQGEGGFGSLNDALKSPTLMSTVANGVPSSRDAKAKRRESAMLGYGMGSGLQKKTSMSKLNEQEGGSF